MKRLSYISNMCNIFIIISSHITYLSCDHKQSLALCVIEIKIMIRNQLASTCKKHINFLKTISKYMKNYTKKLKYFIKWYIKPKIQSTNIHTFTQKHDKFLYNMNTSLHLPKKMYKISFTPIIFLKIIMKYMKT